MTEAVPQFKKGDMVRMRTGQGVRMIVTEVGKTQLGEDGVWCEWVDSSGKRQSDTFSPYSLEIAPPPAKSGSFKINRG